MGGENVAMGGRQEYDTEQPSSLPRALIKSILL